MQLRQIPTTRPPSRLAYNKENIHNNIQNSPKKHISLEQKPNQQKHNYDIYFPKDSVKRKSFFDQP